MMRSRVELELMPEQELLRETSERFIGDRCPLTKVREIAEGVGDLDDGYSTGAAQLGWFAMFVDEQFGGGSVSGDPMGDAAVVSELRGRLLQPGPFADVNAAAAVLSASGTDAQRRSVLPGAVEGASLVAMPVGGDAFWGGPALTARRTMDGYRLDGSVSIVDSAAIDRLLVAADSDDGRIVVLVPLEADGVRSMELQCLDLTRPLREVDLGSVVIRPEAVVPADAGTLARAAAIAVALSVTETVGSMSALFEMTVQYAKDRVAFGRPIGSFQALKHLLADLSVVVESSKAVAVAAVRSLRARHPYAAEVTSIAKVYVAERAAAMAQECLQVHGGIGFAWEHDLHLFLRRVTADAMLFGTADQHRVLILAAHVDELRVA